MERQHSEKKRYSRGENHFALPLLEKGQSPVIMIPHKACSKRQKVVLLKLLILVLEQILRAFWYTGTLVLLGPQKHYGTLSGELKAKHVYITQQEYSPNIEQMAIFESLKLKSTQHHEFSPHKSPGDL